jgi:Mycothiol maleylpyruvate isomerase N-terminal domain
MGTERRDDLASELDAARNAYRDALGDVDAALATAPGIVGTWSARDLTVHVAFWAEHGAAALGLAGSGRGGEFDYDTTRTDAMNESLLAEAVRISPMAAADREEAAYRAFRAALAALDPALLDLVLGNGHTVERVVRYDGPDHYAEHTEHLRAWFGVEPEPDDE